MGCATCGRNRLAALASAAAKSAAARLRRLGALPNARNWPQRAAVCELCHLRVIYKGVSYCGQPFLHRPLRDQAIDGCGCPCADKAKRPAEHCPLNARSQPRNQIDGRCDCKWCQLAASL